jgi:hypothetical protein
MNKPLPPYGNHYLNDPRNGVHVALGPSAWEWAKKRRYPVMVLPNNERPTDRRWPPTHGPALIWEVGTYDTDRLTELAISLFRAGATSVVAIREAEMNDDPRTFFDKKVIPNGNK